MSTESSIKEFYDAFFNIMGIDDENLKQKLCNMDLERSIGDRRDASFYKHRHDRKHSK
jgi:hypothetical protein